MTIDPVCAFHGKRRSQHECLYCCVCFAQLTRAECWLDEDGAAWDLCEPCGQQEAGPPQFRPVRGTNKRLLGRGVE